MAKEGKKARRAPRGDRSEAEFEAKCRRLAGPPLSAAADFDEICAIVGDGVTKEDVFKGISQATAKASFTIRYWKKMVGWARYAARQRVDLTKHGEAATTKRRISESPSSAVPSAFREDSS